MTRTRLMARRASPARAGLSPSQRPAQVFVEQALVDQLAPIERLLELAHGNEAVDHGGQSLLGEVATAPMLPLVVFRQDGICFRERHFPHFGIDARGILAIADAE